MNQPRHEIVPPVLLGTPTPPRILSFFCLLCWLGSESQQQSNYDTDNQELQSWTCFSLVAHFPQLKATITMRPYQRSWNAVQPMEVDSHTPLSPQMMEVDDCDHNNLMHGGCQRRRRQQPIQKRVSFADECLLYRSNRTTDDVQRMWYSKDELATFKGKRREMIRYLKQVKFDLGKINQEKICLRGYEPYFSPAMNKATKYARELVSTLVFVEQRQQRARGIFDPESLRERSCQASFWARDIGLELGNTDARLNPLRVECLGRRQEASDLVNGAQLKIATVDDNTVKQLESTLTMLKSMLN